MKIKVYGKNGNSRIMTANTQSDITKISNCFDRWEFVR